MSGSGGASRWYRQQQRQGYGDEWSAGDEGDEAPAPKPPRTVSSKTPATARVPQGIAQHAGLALVNSSHIAASGGPSSSNLVSQIDSQVHGAGPLTSAI